MAAGNIARKLNEPAVVFTPTIVDQVVVYKDSDAVIGAKAKNVIACLKFATAVESR